MSGGNLYSVNRLIFCLVALLVVSNSADAVVKNKPLLSRDKIVSFTVEVAGVSRIVKPSETVASARGEDFKVVAAEWEGQHERTILPIINIVGFNGGSNDLNKLVRTDKDLIKKWSVHQKGEIYRVRAEYGSQTFGDFFVEIKTPELRFVIAEVNGKERIIYPNSQIMLSSKDKIRIKRIATNIEENDQNTKFSMQPLMGPHNIQGIDFYNLKITRKDMLLAGITVVVNH